MRPSWFAALITFAVWGHSLMDKTNLGFSALLSNSPNNFRVFPLFLIFYPMKITVGYQPNDFLLRAHFGNSKIHIGISKVHGAFIVQFAGFAFKFLCPP